MLERARALKHRETLKAAAVQHIRRHMNLPIKRAQLLTKTFVIRFVTVAATEGKVSLLFCAPGVREALLPTHWSHTRGHPLGLFRLFQRLSPYRHSHCAPCYAPVLPCYAPVLRPRATPPCCAGV